MYICWYASIIFLDNKYSHTISWWESLEKLVRYTTYVRLNGFIEYCSNHTVSHVCSISNEFLKRFPPKNCVAVFVIKEYRRGVSTNMLGLYLCEDLTDGVAFVVKLKKSKIIWITMNALQFSTMHTIIDVFPVIRS